MGANIEFKSSDEKPSGYWTTFEEDLLKKLYANHSNEYIAKLLNKTIASVNSKGALLGLKKSKNYRQQVNKLNNLHKRHAWTWDEVNFLKENYKKISYTEIAKLIKRTPNAVSQKARQLNLKKYKNSK